ncbi:MAG TPA: AAA family ATPase, partial [Chitinophagales bacterium]|nr:AAA family ATPase [Chitinophagales bacterium]
MQGKIGVLWCFTCYNIAQIANLYAVGPEIKWIKSLDTKGFRSFCFNDAKLFFGQVNLFYGANGAGKSSVLEAIEYALTSEIRRMNDFKVKLSLDTNPVVDVYNREAGIIHF